MTEQELIRQAKQTIKRAAIGDGGNEIILAARLADVTWLYDDAIVTFTTQVQRRNATVTVHATPCGWRRADLYGGAEMVARFTI